MWDAPSEAFHTPMERAVGNEVHKLQSRVGTMAMLATVRPLVKLTVDVVGVASSPTHAARNPLAAGLVTVTFTAKALIRRSRSGSSKPKAVSTATLASSGVPSQSSVDRVSSRRSGSIGAEASVGVGVRGGAGAAVVVAQDVGDHVGRAARVEDAHLPARAEPHRDEVGADPVGVEVDRRGRGRAVPVG